MNKRKILTFILVLTLFLQSFTAVVTAGAASPSKEAVIAAMSTEEKIAQMLMPTFRTYDGEGVTVLNQKQKDIIAKYPFAGVILFGENNKSTEQTLRLIDEMQMANIQKESRPQLLISVDQEGAGVTRLSHGTQGPGNMALGATGNVDNAYDIGNIIGNELSAVGYNVDFAPVVDVNSNPSNPVIGVRSFSDDAATVAAYGSAFMDGLQNNNVMVALKHFPGHGDTATDSHTGLPRIDKTYEQLKENELVPFEQCMTNGAEMVMTAHIQYPNIEPATYTSKKDGSQIELPATLSKTIITDILRNDMGYDGVVVTDAMNMSAIAAHFDALDAAKLAINAGVDIILMPVDTGSAEGIDALEKYIQDVAALADSGAISMENINRALMRILTLKERGGLLSTYHNADLEERVANANSTVGSKAHHDTEWKIAKKSITLVKNDGVLPIKDSRKTVILVPYANEVKAAEYAIDRLKEDSIIPQDADISVFLTRNKTADEIKVAVEGADHVLAVAEQYSQAGLAGAAYQNLDSVADYVHENGGKICFISCNLPYDTARLQKGDAILLAYSCNGMNEKPDFSQGSVATYGVSIPAGIYTAFDESARLGALPVDIRQLDSEYHYTDSILYERGFGLQYEKEYHFTAGENQTFDVVKDKRLLFAFDMDKTLFATEGKVYIDGVEVDRAMYDLADGSMLLTLKDAFVHTLALGEHTLKVEVFNGALTTNFTLIKSDPKPTGDTPEAEDGTADSAAVTTVSETPAQTKNTPKTGEDKSLYLAVTVSLIATCGAVAAMVIKKRKINN